jgi:hypothetical protein
MKHFILLPLFALLPFIAFPNDVFEADLTPEVISTEIVELVDNEVEPVDCTVTVTANIDTPIGGFDVECKATATECKEAVRMAKDCLEAAKDEVTSIFGD